MVDSLTSGMNRDAYLRRIVLNHPAGNCGDKCALYRLRGVLPNAPSLLTRCAERIGYTEAEALGIMDGWDMTFGLTCAFLDEADDKGPDDKGYDDGFKLGMALALAAKALP
jgi:hypothetical protein